MYIEFSALIFEYLMGNLAITCTVAAHVQKGNHDELYTHFRSYLVMLPVTHLVLYKTN